VSFSSRSLIISSPDDDLFEVISTNYLFINAYSSSSYSEETAGAGEGGEG
jgi:hypothetical protein